MTETLKTNPERLETAEESRWDQFCRAFEAYNTAYAATTAYSALANDRFMISVKPGAVFREGTGDEWVEPAAVFQVLASFAPYTEAELEAHTAALEVLTSAFEHLNSTSAGFKRGEPYYSVAVECCRAAGKSYAFAADSYSRAVSAAAANAVEAQLHGAAETAIGRTESLAAFRDKAGAFYRKAEVFETKARGCRNLDDSFSVMRPGQNLRDSEAAWAVLMGR